MCMSQLNMSRRGFVKAAAATGALAAFGATAVDGATFRKAPSAAEACARRAFRASKRCTTPVATSTP